MVQFQSRSTRPTERSDGSSAKKLQHDRCGTKLRRTKNSVILGAGFARNRISFAASMASLPCLARAYGAARLRRSAAPSAEICRFAEIFSGKRSAVMSICQSTLTNRDRDPRSAPLDGVEGQSTRGLYSCGPVQGSSSIVKYPFQKNFCAFFAHREMSFFKTLLKNVCTLVIVVCFFVIEIQVAHAVPVTRGYLKQLHALA